MIHNETVYAVYGLPPQYAKITWESLEVNKDDEERIKNAFKNPISSVVFIQGVSAPIIQQLLEQKLRVRGIDLGKRQNAAFEEHNNPDADVVLVYNVNKYSGKPEISINLLNSIIQYYRSKNVLVIVESQESSIFMRDNYSFSTNNKLKLLQKQEVKWLS